MAKKKDLGHSAHSKKADNVIGLEGVMPRPIKITMLGAGSGFTPHLFNDIMSIPGMRKLEFCLVDIDKKRLDVMYKLTKRMAHDFVWKTKSKSKRQPTESMFFPIRTTSFVASKSAVHPVFASTTTFRSNTASTNASATPSGPAVFSKDCAPSPYGSTFLRTAKNSAQTLLFSTTQTP